MQIEHPLTVFLPDTRGVTLSRFGRGNLKIGAGVYTYSRLPGHPSRVALGARDHVESDAPHGLSYLEQAWQGTCPGATEECQRICYAARPVTEMGPVAGMWLGNRGDDVPELPADAKLLRIHVSGDFDTPVYIINWRLRLIQRPDVTAWVYTRSWRVPSLLNALERLRALPNVQMFASMDKSHDDVPPVGWRRAWIDGDLRAGKPTGVRAFGDDVQTIKRNGNTYDGTWSFVCPEETGDAKDCESCRYCFDGKRNDVTFLEH